MKLKLTVLAFFVALFSLWSQKIVEIPFVEYANTKTIEISKVTLSKKETILDIEVNYTPKYWIKITKDSYLNANGKKYKIHKGEGITLDQQFWIPESGKASFKLFFELLPENTSSFDFIEGDCEDCFKIYGINLTNKVQLPKIPKEYTQKYKTNPKFKAEFKKGNALVKGQIIGYRTDFGDVFCKYENPITGNSTQYTINCDKEGNFSISIPIYSPTTLSIVLKKSFYIPLKVALNEESKIIINLPEKTRQESNLRKKSKKYGEKVYYAGFFADVNRDFMSVLTPNELFEDQNIVHKIISQNISEINYKDYLLNKYDSIINYYNKQKINPLSKKILILNTTCAFLDKISLIDYVFSLVYAQKNNIPVEEAYKSYIPFVWDENMDNLYKILPIDDPNILFIPNSETQRLKFSRASSLSLVPLVKYMANQPEIEKEDRLLLEEFINSFERKETFNKIDLLENIYEKHEETLYNYQLEREGAAFFSKIWNTDNALLIDLIKSQTIGYNLTKKQPFTKKEQKEIKKLPKLFQEALLAENNALIAEMQSKKEKTGFNILDAPQNADENLLVELIKPFKGKVILIDIWATWCMPCLSAHKQMEAIKSEFSDKDVIFLYLADEYSNKNTWEHMITNIKGHHYWLNKAQTTYIQKIFSRRAYPSYIIIDKNGNISYYSVGFEGIEKIKSELTKAL